MEPDPTDGDIEVGGVDGRTLGDRYADDIAALHAVVSLAPGDPDDRLTLLIEAGCAALGADTGVVLLRTGTELSVRVVAGPRPFGLTPGQQLRDRRVDDVLARQVTVASLGGGSSSGDASPLGTGALVACPMWITGRVVGAIAFTSPGSREPFTAWQLALVDLVADGASRVLEHEADIRALVRLESQSQAMISVIPDPVVRLHRDGHRVAAGGDAERELFDPCAGARTNGSEADEATLERVRAAVARALDTGELQTEVYAAGPGPLARRMEARYVPSGPDEVLCIVRDITDRHRAEVALAEQVAFEALATSISTQLIGGDPAELDAAIESGLGEIALFFDADVAYIDELSADGTTLRVSHQWTRSEGLASRRRGDVVDVAGFEWLTARFERDGHVFTRGRGTFPAEATEAALDGNRGGLWVRLGYGGELVGVLGMAWSTHEPPENDEVLGLVRFAADAFLGAIRRRSVALLAQSQAEVFELIARGAPTSTALLSARSMLQRNTLGATVLVATVDDDSHLSLVVHEDDERDWSGWFAAVEPNLDNPFGQAVVTGEPVVVADILGDPRFGGHALPDARFRSASIEPIRSPRNGKTLALVAMLGTDRGVPQPRSEVRDSVRSLITVAVERSIDERRLAHQATHDPLTGVGNRAALLDRLTHALARSRRTGRSVAVLFCDLDGFKAVNDRYGHDRGDRLLVEVAARIAHAVRPSDTVCRTGGDEFVVVCEDLDDDEQAQAITERVRSSIEHEPVDVGEAQLPVTVSVGMALTADAGDDPDRLLRTADLAMYARKQRRRADAAPTPADGPVIDLVDEAAKDLATDLGRALDEGGITLVHQPLVGRDATLVGVEALMRWEHPTLGDLSPDRILEAAAADPALAARLGQWVRRTGLAQRATWGAEAGPEPGAQAPLHVNVSGTELVTPGFTEVLLEDLEDAGAAIDDVVVEVPERGLADREARATVSQLARAGVAVLVEDAGLGGMPLPDLAELAVRGIKLSRSLVSRVTEDDPMGVEVVRSLVLLAHGLGWRSVGDGVETDHQRSVLFGFGVHAVQGRAITMPVSAEDLRTWLAYRSRG